LARTLVAIGLLCMAFAIHRQTYSAHIYVATILEAAFGICLSAAVGVVARRTVAFCVGAVIAVIPGAWYTWWLYHLPPTF
jgi:putative Mn2+ efflux pump MntP